MPTPPTAASCVPLASSDGAWLYLKVFELENAFVLKMEDVVELWCTRVSVSNVACWRRCVGDTVDKIAMSGKGHNLQFQVFAQFLEGSRRELHC